MEPEGQTIKVDQVRQIQKELVYRPYEGKRRVCILTAADRMAPNMSNILLKTLEEPPLHTVIILLANNPRLLLPTILSRCQTIRFNPLPVPSGPPVVDGGERIERRGSPSARLSFGGQSWKGPGDPGRDPPDSKGRPSEGMVGIKTLSFEEMESWVDSLPSERESLLLILEVAKTLLRDLVMVKTVKDGSKLIHSDLLEEMETIASSGAFPALLKRIEVLHQTILAISPIRGNANTRLALEAMMLSWAEG